MTATRVATAKRVALATARERRRRLDEDRDRRDEQIEQATAEALMALEALAHADAVRAQAAAGVARALEALMGEDGVTLERAGALLDLSPDEINAVCAGQFDSKGPERDSSRAAVRTRRPRRQKLTPEGASSVEADPIPIGLPSY